MYVNYTICMTFLRYFLHTKSKVILTPKLSYIYFFKVLSRFRLPPFYLISYKNILNRSSPMNEI